MSASIRSLFIINKAGGLVYQREFTKNSKRSANDNLVLAGTLHGVHAITAKISPELGSSGLEVLEAETFSLYCFQTQTGVKFVAIVRPDRPNVEGILRKIYELYADYVLKNPFYTPDMPIRCDRFDAALHKLVRIDISR